MNNMEEFKYNCWNCEARCILYYNNIPTRPIIRTCDKCDEKNYLIYNHKRNTFYVGSGPDDGNIKKSEADELKYEPWKEKGITELQYFHKRYLEERAKVQALRKKLIDAIWWIKENAMHAIKCSVWKDGRNECDCNRTKIRDDVENRFGIIRGYERGIIQWPYLAEICLYKSHRSNFLANIKYKSFTCGHGANGKEYRCCKLMCPIWDDLTGDPGEPKNQVVDCKKD